eukprot:2893491-Rhodomonas_salina.1
MSPTVLVFCTSSVIEGREAISTKIWKWLLGSGVSKAESRSVSTNWAVTSPERRTEATSSSRRAAPLWKSCSVWRSILCSVAGWRRGCRR